MIIGNLQLVLNDMLKDFIGKKYNSEEFDFYKDIENRISNMLVKNNLDYYYGRIAFDHETIFRLDLVLDPDRRCKRKSTGKIIDLKFELEHPELKSEKISDLNFIIEKKRLNYKIEERINSIVKKEQEIEKLKEELTELETDLILLNSKSN